MDRIIPARAGFTRPGRRPGARPRDHPRSRGVYGGCGCGSQLLYGSSPLARGLRRAPRSTTERTRIIPARAGFTQGQPPLDHRNRDHPRSRGVYVPARAAASTTAGSSPLARGLPRHPIARTRSSRIIPARAGFTPHGPRTGSGTQDHPRSRGVYSISWCARGRSAGSSPLARGLPRARRQPRVRDRIIPARAGFTAVGGVVEPHLVDHPRSRGVYRALAGPGRAPSGSSPLAWGLRALPERLEPATRIIPARAGFTSCPRRGPRRREDHPRSRGVYPRLKDHINDREGSSPLARGLLAVKRSLGELLGIIPARAGFTPRTARGTVVEPGSSPLARGLHLGRLEQRGQARIIPARAGFTDRHDRRGGGLGDHPRSRGVYRPTAWRRRRSRRIIPARAGFTTTASTTRDATSDHPRSRGVYEGHVEVDDDLRGSSPLARGLPDLLRDSVHTRGIIPARAGFTALGKTGPFDWADHPRSRGVYPCSKSTSGFPDWIIPARAGFTSPDSPAPSLSQDHPRSRGVYSSCAHAPSPFFGSSPLARGLLLEKGVEDRRGRIIPARAGFTGARSRPARVGRDHPRSRGVYVATKAALNH